MLASRTASSAVHTSAPLSLDEISALAFLDEREAMQRLLAHVEPLSSLEPEIMPTARRWAGKIREGGMGAGMEAFLQTYGLETKEGVALMCLAEALLRIPDATTADRLIEGTFEGKDWRQHVTGDENWLISASSWGLLLTGKVVDFGSEPAGGVGGAMRSLVGRLGEPVIRTALKQAMKIIGSQFVLGETVAAGITNAKPYGKKGFGFSYDILGEGARSEEQAQGYIRAYHEAIALIGASPEPISKNNPHPNPLPKREREHEKAPSPSQGEGRDEGLFRRPSISVKLSALHPRYSLTQQPRVLGELAPRLKAILLLAKQHNITVSIDAEEANRLDIELELFSQLLRDPELAGWNGIGFVLQAYQKRAFYVVDWLATQARALSRVLPLRLVKGAYWDSEIKHAQVYGLPGYPVFTHKAHTDVSYLACAEKMLSGTDCFYPQFATHNARTIASIRAMAAARGLGPQQFEFQRLHGMGEALHLQVLEDGYFSRVYAPIGEHKDLLAYLIRRLLENGANTSFVNLLMDKDTTLEQLLADPVASARLSMRQSAIALPEALYPDRKNSHGCDLGYRHAQAQLLGALSKHAALPAAPAALDSAGLEAALQRASTAFPAWAATPLEQRCFMLEKLADVMEDERDMLMHLLCKEAGKTLPDALSEVREAADFCRYYALQARRLMAAPMTLDGPTGESNQLSLHPRGVFACISPWNFPLAIFTGQVVAALITGNCVLAKPAEQTPRIAAAAVALMHRVGIPPEVVQLTVGRGSVIGAAMTSDARISGIVFTGSVEVAQTINRALAARSGPIVPFIAETGGQNCMVVDSSALLEQAVDDILLSAFGSAGQRCSALRVLFVQEDIADALLALLKGALAELSLGDPALPATDVGPVIDAKAQQELLAHIERMQGAGKRVAQANAPAAGISGAFVPPHIFEIADIAMLEKEVFGPVLHVVRFKASERESVAARINATGFGLTFGIHSRIEENIRFFTQRIHAGNHYVNRSMIGAVVGVQPFGGEGLSGTGPKAGGPYYLLKFLHERTVTTNVAAIGGNLALLTGGKK